MKRARCRAGCVVYALGFVAVPAMIGGAVYLTSWAIEQSIAAVPGVSQALSSRAAGGNRDRDTRLDDLVQARSGTAVPVRDALIGALLAATAFELAKVGFKFYIRQVPTYRIVSLGARGFAAFSDLDLCFVGHPAARRRGDGDACRTRRQGAQSPASCVTISIAQATRGLPNRGGHAQSRALPQAESL